MKSKYDQPITSGTPAGVDVEPEVRSAKNKEWLDNNRRVIRISTIRGDAVRNPAGESLGDIEDVMIDMATGRIAYVVLSFGGFLGMGNKFFAIPWEALTLSREDNQFVLNVPRERLEKAPGFDKDNWPDMADRTWGSQVYAYYGYKPYWDR